MSHIFLIILKIVGWVILAILGLVVLLLCLVLFTPLRYQIQACSRGTMDTLNAELRFSVFFHLISGQIRYMDGSINWNIRAAWKKITSEKTDGESRTNISAEREYTDFQVEKKMDRSVEKEPNRSVEKDPDISAVKKLDTLTEKSEVKKENQTALSATEVKETEKRTVSVFEKIKYTFQTFCAKISALLRKKEILMEFVKEEAHQAAVCKVLKELKRLLLRLKPKKMSGMVHFGFEDPSLTGYMLAGVSMIYPLTDEQFEVQPDFEQKVLEGSLYVKGHVRTARFASFALRIIGNRNVRTTIHDIKNFSFDA